MKAYAVLVGVLIGVTALACSDDSTGLCLDSAYCQDTFCFSCPNGRDQEPYCGPDDRCVCPACLPGTGGTGGSAGTGGNGGSTGGTGGAESCVLDVECSLFGMSDCDTPCKSFCGSSGTEAYGQCGTNVDPSQPQPDAYYCVCYCSNETCPS